MYRVDPDAILVLEVYAKKTRKIPRAVIDRCKKQLKEYDDTVRKAAKGSAKEPPKKGKG
jgi:phage-related protein